MGKRPAYIPRDLSGQVVLFHALFTADTSARSRAAASLETLRCRDRTDAAEPP